MLSKKEVRKRTFGGALLIAGCCIGAGMLGLPVVAAETGFIPTAALFALVWAFMCATGILLLEVNLWFPKEVSLITMAGRTLGKGGQALCWLLFCYLFYSIMIAYVDASGSLVQGFFETVGLTAPKWIGSALFTLFFALLIYVGTGAVDRFNRILMVGLILSYALLVTGGLAYVEPKLLWEREWSHVYSIVPIMIISFGFHNLVPSMTTYLQRDRKALVRVIVWGSVLPLVIYLLWVGIVLGVVPKELLGVDLATEGLKKVAKAPSVIFYAEAFAFFAIVSSFLSVALSFVDFLADGLQIRKDARGKAKLIGLTLLPAFCFALIYPGIFLQALGYAGAFGTVILFGILPVCMVWRGRASFGKALLPGGRPLLVVIALAALSVSLLKIAQDLGVLQ